MRPIGMALLALVLAAPARADVMYGSASGQNTLSAGGFGTVDQNTAIFTLLGNPTSTISGAGGLSGIAFDASGRLWGSVATSSPRQSTHLIEINPATGALINDVGLIHNSSNTNLRIVDLAAQPSSSVLFGIDSNADLYTIDKSTALATLVGSTGLAEGGIAFAPDGTLYLTDVNRDFAQLDPSTGLPVAPPLHLDTSCLDGLAVRPSDGSLFATECDGRTIYRIDPTTGAAVQIDPGSYDSDVADLAFQATPLAGAPTLSPLGMGLLVAGLFAFGLARQRLKPVIGASR